MFGDKKDTKYEELDVIINDKFIFHKKQKIFFEIFFLDY
jgi:hypothetical protein